MPPGHPLKRSKIDPSRYQEVTFSLLNFDLVLGSILSPFWLPKSLPWGTLLATKIDQKIDQKLNCSKSRSKIAPRPPKTLPRCPPDPSGGPKMPFGRPKNAPRCLPEPPRTTQNAFRSLWPNNLFQKNQKSRNRRKHVEKKEVDNGHPRWSPASVLTKTESTFKTVEPQRVAAVVARSALQSAAPSAARRVVNPP